MILISCLERIKRDGSCGESGSTYVFAGIEFFDNVANTKRILYSPVYSDFGSDSAYLFDLSGNSIKVEYSDTNKTRVELESLLVDCCGCDSADYLAVNNTPLTYIPSSSGNTENLNEAVTDSDGDIWIIDINGNAKKVNIGTSDTGGVTQVSAQSLSPLFTTTVNNPTTTPDIIFTLPNINQYQVFGRVAAGAGLPSWVTLDNVAFSGDYNDLANKPTIPLQYWKTQPDGKLVPVTYSRIISTNVEDSGYGSIALIPSGTPGDPGILGFYQADGTTVGYIGGVGTRMNYHSSIGNHYFNAAPVQIQTMAVNESAPFIVVTDSNHVLQLKDLNSISLWKYEPVSGNLVPKNIFATIATNREDSGYGGIRFIPGGTELTGRIEFFRNDNTRTGFIGYNYTDIWYLADLGKHIFKTGTVQIENIPNDDSLIRILAMDASGNIKYRAYSSFGSGYTLPISSASVLGGIKVGSGLTIDPATGILSTVNSGTDSQTLSWNSSTGDLSILNGNTVNLDGRYSLLSHNHTLASLSDTTISSPANNQLLKYDTVTAKWINWTPDFLTSYTETDPTVPSWVKAITTTDIANWNSAYSWGNHAGLYVPLNRTITINGNTQNLSADRTYTIDVGVTSVALALPANTFSISGSPVTNTGTLTGSFISQTSRFVFAAPWGVNGTPIWRRLQTSDLAPNGATTGQIIRFDGTDWVNWTPNFSTFSGDYNDLINKPTIPIQYWKTQPDGKLVPLLFNRIISTNVQDSGYGSVALLPGGTSLTGRVEFYRSNGTTRTGFIGYDNTDIWYLAELGKHIFKTGTLQVDNIPNDNTITRIWGGDSAGNLKWIDISSFGGGGNPVWKVQGSSTDATSNTQPIYHNGQLAVGNFSGSTSSYNFHVIGTSFFSGTISSNNSVAFQSYNAGATAFLEVFKTNTSNQFLYANGHLKIDQLTSGNIWIDQYPNTRLDSYVTAFPNRLLYTDATGKLLITDKTGFYNDHIANANTNTQYHTADSTWRKITTAAGTSLFSSAFNTGFSYNVSNYDLIVPANYPGWVKFEIQFQWQTSSGSNGQPVFDVELRRNGSAVGFLPQWSEDVQIKKSTFSHWWRIAGTNVDDTYTVHIRVASGSASMELTKCEFMMTNLGKPNV